MAMKEEKASGTAAKRAPDYRKAAFYDIPTGLPNYAKLLADYKNMRLKGKKKAYILGVRIESGFPTGRDAAVGKAAAESIRGLALALKEEIASDNKYEKDVYFCYDTFFALFDEEKNAVKAMRFLSKELPKRKGLFRRRFVPLRSISGKPNKNLSAALKCLYDAMDGAGLSEAPETAGKAKPEKEEKKQ